MVALLVGAVALAARLFRASAQSLWYDEGTSAAIVFRPPAEIIAAAANDIHPPLYYLILSLWAHGFGDGVIALRTLSALIGAIGAIGVWALARRIAGPRVAALAGLLAATSPLLVWYGQEVRMYVLAGALGAWLPWVALRVVDRRVGDDSSGPARARVRVVRIDAVLALVLTLAALYTHYAAGASVVLAANVVAAIALARRWRVEGRVPRIAATLWIGTQAAAGALFIPWLVRAWPTISTWPALGEPLGAVGIARGAAQAYAVGVKAPASAMGWWPLFAVVVAAVVAAVVVFAMVSAIARVGADSVSMPSGNAGEGRSGSGPGFAVSVGFAALLAPSGLLMYLDRSRPAWDPKFLIGGAAGFEILLAISVLLVAGVRLNSSGRRRSRSGGSRWSGMQRHSPGLDRLALVRVLAAGALLGFLLWPRASALRAMYTDPAYQRDDYRGIAAEIAAAAGPDDAVILVAPTQIEIFDYYDRGSHTTYPLPRQRPPDYADTLERLESIGDEHRDIFGIIWADDQADPDGWIRDWLNSERHLVYDRWYGGVRLVRWAGWRGSESGSRSESGSDPDSAKPFAGTTFGGQIELRDVRVGSREVIAGDVVTLEASWAVAPAGLEPEGVPRTDVVVLTQLLGADGALIAQRDFRPVAGTQATSTWQEGDVWVDRIGVEVQRDAAPGEYTLILGLYDPADGRRLAPEISEVGDAGEIRDDVLVLGTVRVMEGGSRQ